MSTSDDAITVQQLDGMEFQLDPAPWELERRQEEEIAAHFEKLKRANPSLWNAPVLMLAEHRFDKGILRGSYKRTAYAALLWWRDHGCPELRNAFGMGAVRGADGGFLLGRMAGWTANPGRIYFAAGTPDLSDLTIDGRVDIEGSVMREVAEEIGLVPADFHAARPGPSGLHAVFANSRVALMRELVAREEAGRLAERVRANLARQERAELEDVMIVRSPADLDPAMPDFVRAYLLARWRNEVENFPGEG